MLLSVVLCVFVFALCVFWPSERLFETHRLLEVLRYSYNLAYLHSHKFILHRLANKYILVYRNITMVCDGAKGQPSLPSSLTSLRELLLHKIR